MIARMAQKPTDQARRLPVLTQVFEDQNIRVETCLNEGDTVVVAFNSYSGDDTDGTRFGYPFLPRNGFSSIHVTARQSHWWQVADQRSFLDAILPLIAPYRRRISYGSSMGGYGALLYARDLGVTGVVSVVPQTIISDPAFKMKGVWRLAINRVTITKDDIAETIGDVPDVRLLYDPWRDIDRAFADYVARFTPVTHYLFPFVGHKVPNFLADIGIITPTMNGILRGTLAPQEVRAAMRPVRRNSGFYVANMEKRCRERQERTLVSPA